MDCHCVIVQQDDNSKQSTMFVKLAIFSCSIAAALAAWHGPLAGGSPAAQFPAGVSPQACPNYPHCNNPAVAANPSGPAHGGWNGGWNGGNAGGWNGGAGAGAGAGGWNGGAGAGGWNGGDHGAWNGNALENGEYTGDGDYRGEGLAESGAYGDISHNYNSDNGGAWNGAGAGGWNGGHAGAGAWAGAGAGHAAQLPAGVDGHACPNYPFCH